MNYWILIVGVIVGYLSGSTGQAIAKRYHKDQFSCGSVFFIAALLTGVVVINIFSL